MTMADRPRMDIADLRPEVLAFAFLMEQRLSENDHKPGWQADPPALLLARVIDETAELARAVHFHLNNPDNTDPVAHEAADVASFAMMLVDRFACDLLDIDHARELIGENADGYEPDIHIHGEGGTDDAA